MRERSLVTLCVLWGYNEILCKIDFFQAILAKVVELKDAFNSTF